VDEYLIAFGIMIPLYEHSYTITFALVETLIRKDGLSEKRNLVKFKVPLSVRSLAKKHT
jgi:hypothetical protein